MRHGARVILPDLFGTNSNTSPQRALRSDIHHDFSITRQQHPDVTLCSHLLHSDTNDPSERVQECLAQWLFGENVEAFITLEDASDIRILMGMLIPPSALIQSQGGIGSQSVAETLGELFWESQRIRKGEMDQQFTDYVISDIVRLNFGAGAPECRMVTKRFRLQDQKVLDTILKIIANRQDLAIDQIFDLKGMATMAGLPLGPMGQVMKENSQNGEAP